jgi:carbonic anhydrase/acetyltransferase-like protein (isoleucine patch superfamily)
MNDNITGWLNVAIGPTTALSENENGSRNIAIGGNSLRALRCGTRNIGIGTFSMLKLVNGERNIAIGADALYWAKYAEDNVIIGKAALANMIGDASTVNVKRNIAIGTQALLGNRADSEDNVAVGYRALASSPDKKNVAVGSMAGYYLRGTKNTVVGHNAQSKLYCTGENNTIIGAEAEAYISGGTSSNPTEINNAIAIGKGAQAVKSNQVVIGNTNNNEFVLGNKKLIFNQDGTVSWETVS